MSSGYSFPNMAPSPSLPAGVGARVRALVFASTLLSSATPAGAAPPGEVSSLAWCSGLESCLSWSATAGATSYVLHRGDAASLPRLAAPDTDSCRVGTFPAASTGALPGSEPIPSDGLEWFLVAARNADGEGTVGAASDGPRRSSPG